MLLQRYTPFLNSVEIKHDQKMSKVKFIKVFNGQKEVAKENIKELPEDLFNNLFGAKSEKDSTPKDASVVKLSDDIIEELESGKKLSIEAIGYIPSSDQKRVAAKLGKLEVENEGLSNHNQELSNEVTDLKRQIEELKAAQLARGNDAKTQEKEPPPPVKEETPKPPTSNKQVPKPVPNKK